MRKSKEQRIRDVRKSNLLKDEYKDIFDKDATDLIRDIEVHQEQVLTDNKSELKDFFNGLFCFVMFS